MVNTMPLILIKRTTNYFSPHIIEHKKDRDIWRWKPMWFLI